MLLGESARGYIGTDNGAARLRAAGLTPRGRCRLYAADTAECLCEGVADDRGALDMPYPARAGGVCLLVGGCPALWSEGTDAVALSLYVARRKQPKRGKRYRLLLNRRFPRKEKKPPRARRRYRLLLDRRFPRKETQPPRARRRYRLLLDRRFPRARKLRAPADAPALGALPALRWGDAAKWKPYFDYLTPCAPIADIAWRFIRTRATDGRECYLGMRAERDAVAEIIALTTGDGSARYLLYARDN